jgi:hypothetical protein
MTRVGTEPMVESPISPLARGNPRAIAEQTIEVKEETKWPTNGRCASIPAIDGPDLYSESNFFETAHAAHVWAPDTSACRHEVSRADNLSGQRGEAQRLSDFIENLQSYSEMAPLRRKRGGIGARKHVTLWGIKLN